MEFFSFDSHGLSRKPGRAAGEPRRPRRRRATGSRAAQNQQGRVESLESRRLLAFDLVAAYAQRIIENLRDGVPHALDVAAARAAWAGAKLGQLEGRLGRGPASGDAAADAKKRVARRRVLRSVP